MDALPTTLISSLNNIPPTAIPPQTRDFCNFRSRTTSSSNNSTHHHHHHHRHPLHHSNSIVPTRRHSFSSYTSATSPSISSQLIFSSPGSATPSPCTTTTKKPSAGYAAALLDIALCTNSLKSVAKDARRFGKLLRNEQVYGVLTDLSIGEKEKGRVVKELAEKGRFQKHLVALLKMLVEKNRVGMVGEVMEEFERMYDEFCGTKVVLVSSAKKMEEHQLLGIAERVQKLSGAVNVKVRNLIDGKLPSSSFAV